MSQFVAQADRAFVDEDYAAADKLYAKASLQRDLAPTLRLTARTSRLDLTRTCKLHDECG